MRSLVVLPLALVCSGCTSVNHYASPVIAPPRTYSVVAAFEATEVVRTKRAAPFDDAKTTTRTLVLYPALIGRIGLTRRLELGGAAHPGRVGVEAKIGVVTDGAVRVSVLAAPALQGGAFVGDVPVLVGLRVHDRLELVVSPGVAYARPVVERSQGYPSGVLARGGIAAIVYVVPSFALVPEVSASTALVGDTPLWATAGLGLRGDIQ